MRMLIIVKNIHLRAALLEVPIYKKTTDIIITNKLLLKLPPAQLE